MVTLDLRGLKCPLPVLRTRKALRRLQAGERLRVLSDDPLAAIDIPHMACEDGHVLLRRWQEGDATAFLLEKAIASCPTLPTTTAGAPAART